jgi:lipopolysaccharide export system protein LptA
VAFERERMNGSGTGATYDRGRDVLAILQDAHIVVAADPATGSGLVDVTSDSAEFARRERYMQFVGAVRLVRDDTLIEADSAIAHLAATEDRLEQLELHGNSKVQAAAPQPGGLEAMSAGDMNLTYAPDGRSLRRATLTGEAVTQIAGPTGQRGRRLSAESTDFELAPDGATLTSLSARERVDLEIPSDGAAVPTRRIRSTSMEGAGAADKGLTAVRFAGGVEFREQRAATNGLAAFERVARSQTLDAVMQPGLGGIDRATFAGGVKFLDGETEATGPDAVYDLSKGSLRLTTSGTSRARVADPRVNIEARTIDLVLDTKAMTADADVRSLLKAQKPGVSQGGKTQKRPAMLRGDQDVNVTAQQLVYDESAGTAVYTGSAVLWQGETAVHGGTITLDDRRGNFTAKTGVRSTWRLEDKDPKTGKVEMRTTTATSEDLAYEDAERRATYTTNARLNGPEGDLRASKIDLYLAAGGNALERLEANDAVTLRSPSRTSSGAHMTYFSADARYVMKGTPVRVLEQLPAECRETVGRTLTFFRSTDTILVDGNDQDRTQTTSGGNCPGPPPGS